MTFFFREYDYSRVVIVYFWLFSIAVGVVLARYAFREGLRVARRRGYNLRYALVVGGGELAGRRGPAPAGAGRTRASRILGLVGDDKRAAAGARRLGGFADLRAVLDAHAGRSRHRWPSPTRTTAGWAGSSRPSATSR